MKVLILTSNDLNEFVEGIQLTQLPKSFRDAICITRRMGYIYIWIDALCIIQDSTSWSVEALRMSTVYQNAACNIVTSSSVNSHGGCFANRNLWNIFRVDLLANKRKRKEKTARSFL